MVFHTVSGTANPTIRMFEKSPNKWYYDEFVAEKVGDIFYCAACHYTHKDRETMRDHLRNRHYRKNILRLTEV